MDTDPAVLAERHRRVAAHFSQVVEATPAAAWDNPAPCAGWTARDVHRMLAGMEPLDQILRASGHYGPRVPVPDDADELTRLIAFTGRRP